MLYVDHIETGAVLVSRRCLRLVGKAAAAQEAPIKSF
jgi:hypothetical protein